MALSIVLCATANSTYLVDRQLELSNANTTKVAKQFNSAMVAQTGKATMQVNPTQQVARQAIAKKVQDAPAAGLNSVRDFKAVSNLQKQQISEGAKKAPARVAAATAADTIFIEPAIWQYRYYADTYDWFMAIANADQSYILYLDYFSDSFAGTFTEADIDPYYSYVLYTDAEGYSTYIDIETVNFTVTDDENGKSVDVVMLGADGNVYTTYAFEAPLPEPIGEKTLAYTEGNLVDLTSSSGMFQFWAEEDGWYTSIVMASYEIEGEYTRNDMADPYYNYIAYFTETDTTIIDFLDLNVVVTKEGKTYTMVADALGSDTIMYHITMSYTRPDPVDTVSIVATNLYIDEFELWGMVFATVEASNDEYGVMLLANQFMTEGQYGNSDITLGSSTITDKVAMTEVTLVEADLTIVGAGNERVITGNVVGADNVLYQLDLSYVIPEITDTVSIVFNTVATAQYYESDNDWYFRNDSEDFIVTMDIISEKENFAGEYTAEDFLLAYTQIGLIDGDTTALNTLDARAVVTSIGENLYHVEAALTGSNAVLYLVSTDVYTPLGLPYDAEEGSINRIYTDSDEVTFGTDYVAQYGELYLEIVGANPADYMALLFYVEQTEEGTVIPVGTYTIDDSMDYGTVQVSTGYDSNYGQPMPSFYTTLKEQDGSLYYDQFYFMVGGTVTVENIDGHVKVTVDAVNSYDVPMHIEYEASAPHDGKTHLQLDAEEGAVDKTFTVEDNIVLEEYNGFFTLDVYDGSNYLALLLVADKDENTVIPVGTYAIDYSEQTGTVVASSGVNAQGQVSYSFYATMNSKGNLTTPIYFFVDGTVEVSVDGDKLKVEINALNSYDVPVHVVCEYQLEEAETGLPYDEKEGAVNAVYTSKDEVYYTLDFIPDWNELYVDLMAADGSSTATLTFMVEAADEAIVVPAGVYPINETYEIGTVMSGNWMTDEIGGFPYGSYYGTGSPDADGWYIIEKVWYMVDGTVTVENNAGYLKLTVASTNSYGVPVNLTYNAAPEGTNVEDVVVENGTARKEVKNNQLFIIKDGVKYNVLGAVVK